MVLDLYIGVRPPPLPRVHVLTDELLSAEPSGHRKRRTCEPLDTLCLARRSPRDELGHPRRTLPLDRQAENFAGAAWTERGRHVDRR